MSQGRWSWVAVCAGLVLGAGVGRAAEAETEPAWVTRSNTFAKKLLEANAKFVPEAAGYVGLEGYDEQVVDLGPRLFERRQAVDKQLRAELKAALAKEKDAQVRQDLEIMIERVEQTLDGRQIREKHLLEYTAVGEAVFAGLKHLLDPQLEPARRQRALVRLRRYAGLEPGALPLAVLAEQRVRERLRVKGLAGPVKAEVETDLANTQAFVDGIKKLFDEQGVAGYGPALEQLAQQLKGYDAFLRAEVLPRSREDFRLPPAVYALRLRETGVELGIEELMSRAQVSFREIQTEMEALAPLVAREKGLKVTDYRSVLRELKKQQLKPDTILSTYGQRITTLEGLIRQHRILTLPERAMKIRLASEAESAASPAPHFVPPRLIGNTGQQGVFVLPLGVSVGGSKATLDDFTFEAATWTLAVHEGRPGHELQFSTMVERGVSLARAQFAFNSVNVEGWALYAEAEMKRHLPLEGQLASLQARLMRAARAFLDPGLQVGRVTQEEAQRVLREDVGISEGMTRSELSRYTYRAPGQATAYYVGYVKMVELRAEVERLMGSRFDKARFHDFVLSQGLLPPKLLRAAVLEQVPRWLEAPGPVTPATPG